MLVRILASPAALRRACPNILKVSHNRQSSFVRQCTQSLVRGNASLHMRRMPRYWQYSFGKYFWEACNFAHHHFNLTFASASLLAQPYAEPRRGAFQVEPRSENLSCRILRGKSGEKPMNVISTVAVLVTHVYGWLICSLLQPVCRTKLPRRECQANICKPR